ncbi:MAG: bifunctional phosphopantothenoylcysteine decarboxylase/phosphopantothenate--cysteine ligase CoaBC [Bacteroidetes bacterium]|nr:bifunctional phosphopantothenoylcysteine decarboxylase/phosphopantothenate--cysteine ligase CoaBC [Bacteroidota bacterium]
MLNGKKIVLGVTGSIAAYKSALLVRLLVKQGAEVRVVMTESAAHFITPLTLSVLSKNTVYTSYQAENSTWNNHVELGLWGDLLLIAPATANTIAKMAHGLCDNFLMACYLSAKCPVVFAPAMDRDMFLHPSTQKNIATLEKYSNHLIAPEDGALASGLEGPGRMAEPEHIIKLINDFFLPNKSKLKNKTILINAGPTQEAIDPVRYLSNHSTGKMGYALAEAAAQRGARVILVSGPTHLSSKNLTIEVIPVVSANEMADACLNHFEEADISILSAAVADYAPLMVSSQKLKKQESPLTIELKKNIDIASELGKRKKKNQLLIGFALETEQELTNAKIKIQQKNLDFIVLNSLNDGGAGFGTDTNKITILQHDGRQKVFELKSKLAVAHDILNEIELLLP